MSSSRHAILRQIFVGEGRFDLCLRIGELIALQEKTGSGPHALAMRFVNGDWRVGDITETIRLALIGGGLKQREAFDLVERNVVPGYLSDYAMIAQEALLAALVGVEDEPLEEEDGDAGDEEESGNPIAP